VPTELLEVERLTCPADVRLGGRGQPLFVDEAFFLGLEYPGGFNESEGSLITLRHYPSTVPSDRFLVSKTAVFGAAPTGCVEEWFARCIDRVRRRGPCFVSFNTGGDVQIYEPTATPDLEERVEDRILCAAKTLKENLYDKGGPVVRSFVLDAGWQNPKTLYEVDRSKFPHGFGPLLERLGSMETSLGLWLSLSTPLSPVQLDRDFLESQGYGVEPGGKYPCICEPNYNRALRAILKKHVEDHGVAHFKFDFNNFKCASDAHGHLPDESHSFETNLDAQIDVLHYVAALREDLTIVPTCGMWLSPWWLMHADMIWPHGMWDFNYCRKPFALEPRDWALTYRDQNLYELFRKEECQFPISGVTFCGCLGGPRYNIAGPTEKSKKLADAVVHAYARQLALRRKELSSPMHLSDTMWEMLRGALRWALHRSERAAEGRMILGEPARGELYGYSHLGEAGGVMSLRNPSMHAQTVCLPLDGLAEGGEYGIELTYPYRRVLARAATREDRIPVTIGPYEVTAVEARPIADLSRPVLEGVSYTIVSDEPGTLVCDVWSEPGNAVAATVHSPSPICAVQIGDGDPAEARGHTATIELPPFGQKKPVRVKPLPPRKDKEGGMRNCVRIDVPDSSEARLVLLARETTVRSPVISVNMGGWFGGLPYGVSKGEGWVAYFVDLDPQEMNAITWRLTDDADGQQPKTALLLLLERKLVRQRITVRYERVEHRDDWPELPTPFADVQTEVVLLHPLEGAADVVTNEDALPWVEEFIDEFK